MTSDFEQHIFSIHDEASFNTHAIELFRYQAYHCTIYRSYVTSLQRNIDSITHYSQIPCLPISFFKTHTIVSSSLPTQTVFESSKTTGDVSSKHHVVSLDVYERSFLNMFIRMYGNPQDYVFLALLPSYLERSNSSLVYMVQALINASQQPESGFYLTNYDDVYTAIHSLTHKKIFVIGVTFALLDFAERYTCNHPSIIVMETGGMKGRKQEMVRTQVHSLLQKAFGVSHIHSEYGMTELLSQAYSKGDGEFTPAPWMKVMVRDMYDPFSYVAPGVLGGLNIIDLANMYSCAFIETQDVGRILPNNTFTVEGRFDRSDVRGCNLMVSV